MINDTYPVIDLTETGRKLRKLVRRSQYTDADIAEYLGLSSKRAIYRWYKGECLPAIDNFYAISRLFGVAINDMLVEKRSV